VESLSEEDREYVAQSSYTYWNACRKGEISDREAMRNGMALREVARYWDAAKGDRELAFEALKRTSKFRQHYRMDLIRTCFDSTVEYMYDNDMDLAKAYRSFISAELGVHPMFIKAGTTGRGVLVIGARSCKETTEETFLVTIIYMMERACAATETYSQGKEQAMDVVLDIGGFKANCAPRRSTLKTVFHVLQSHYCQRLNVLVVLDPPLWMSALYTVVSAFLDQRTRRKFQMPRGSKAKQSKLAATLRLPSDLDVDVLNILVSVPFETADGAVENLLSKGFRASATISTSDDECSA